MKKNIVLSRKKKSTAPQTIENNHSKGSKEISQEEQ